MRIVKELILILPIFELLIKKKKKTGVNAYFALGVSRVY